MWGDGCGKTALRYNTDVSLPIAIGIESQHHSGAETGDRSEKASLKAFKLMVNYSFYTNIASEGVKQG
jgi:hypothetical protein